MKTFLYDMDELEHSQEAIKMYLLDIHTNYILVKWNEK